TVAETVIYGDDFGNAVQRNAIGGFVDFGAGLAAQEIGEMYHGDSHDMANSLDTAAASGSDTPLQGEFELNYVTHKLAHVVLGATVAGVTGEDILTGAIAAPLGEILTEEFGKHYQKTFEQELEKGGMSPAEAEAYIANAKENSVQYAKLGAGLVALSAGQDVNFATHVAGNSAENNVLPLIGAGLVLAYEAYNVYDTAHEAYEALDAYQKGDTEAAIESSILVGMAVIPGEKLIPAPMRKAAAGFVKNQATKMLRSKIGQAAVKAGGELVDAASSKVQNITARVTDSSLVKGAGKKLQDWGVSRGGKEALHQAENTGKNIDLRVKPTGTAKISRAKDGSRIVEGTQVHHIIPQTLENDKFLKSIGYDIQQRSNKMFLPTVKGDSLLNTNRSFHQGRHVVEVERGIQKSLDAIKEQKILHGWSNEKTIQEIQKQIVTPQRALLREGKIPLNKHFRPEAQDLRDEWMMQRLSD
ncbi:MAG: AHH domain-containing protein, partial [Alphaproteobacteria bacterium]|nr:AHH domain-containing protein [Alphaproteobacteria bacterium]